MNEWKMPPLIKVYEAIGALGDQRVEMIDCQRASVGSSDGKKRYTVEVDANGRKLSSNDNASYWQGYLGYPAIAVLMHLKIIEAPPPDAQRALAGIAWKTLNARFRNDYTKTLAEVERELERRGRDPQAIKAIAQAALEALKRLHPERGSRVRPPRSV